MNFKFDFIVFIWFKILEQKKKLYFLNLSYIYIIGLCKKINKELFY